MNQKNNIAILNYWWAANYGANLTAYALQQLIADSVLVNNADFQQLIADENQAFHIEFSKKYLKTTSYFSNYSSFENLNKNINTFIVGSDQVFRLSINKRISETFLLDFADCHAKKIAFSASFGIDKEKFLEENSQEKIEQMKIAFKSFDFVSVREKSGVDICKDILDIDAEFIIDPVFILDKCKYDDLIQTSKKDFSKKIVSCLFNKTNNNLDEFLEKKYDKKVVELWQSKIAIEDWLKAIRDCEFLVTNSYHAMCFAIIFNKPFIAISKNLGASTRFDSLFEILGIQNQCINNVSEIYEKDCIFNVDYETVNKRIEEERQRGFAFLKKVLEAPVQVTQGKIEARMNFLENKVCELEQQATLKYQIKKELWNFWLIIFHKYLPKPVKNVIRIVRDKYARK